MAELFDLRTNHLTDPLGLGDGKIRFSWKIRSDGRNVLQKTWQIRAWSEGNLIWDSGIVESSQSQNVCYVGEELHSRQRVRWCLEVDTTAGAAKAEAAFEMGLLSSDDWVGRWIEPEEEDAHIMDMVPAPYLRKRFSVKPGLKRARAYQTAHGVYRFWINGALGSSRVFTPGVTSYYKRLQYQVDDITPLLRQGENVWAVRLGDGWWRGGCGAAGLRCNFGRRLHFLGQLVLEYEDGSVEVVATDTEFRTATGGLLECDPKVGTVYDSAKEPLGWQSLGFDDCAWRPVHMAPEQEFANLIPETSVPVREMERLPGTALRDKAGCLVVDFGQNLAGYVRMKLRGLKKGQKILLEHGEGLRDGVFDNSNVFISEASNYDRFQTVIYYASEEEAEYCPEFSVFGFRYVRVTGYDGPILPGDFTAIAVYSDMPVTQTFECSHDLINQLFHNSLWSQKGNFLDVPTDCPTRERSAWSGDAQLYCKTAAQMMDVYTFFEKWMQDVAAEQMPNGQVPSIAPSNFFHDKACKEAFLDHMARDPQGARKLGMIGHLLRDDENADPDCSSGWGDAATIVPYRMYLAYGDKTILENQYESAKAWVDCMIREARKSNPTYADEPWYHNFDENGEPHGNYIWDGGFHFGEWSEPGFVHRTLPENFMEEKLRTGEPNVATAYLSYSAGLLGKMAAILGKQEDAAHYRKVSEKTARYFERYLVGEDGKIRFAEEGRQAPYVRTIAFGLARGEKLEKVKQKLLQLVKDQDCHLNTGFLSTPMLLSTLADSGHVEAAYRVLEQTTPPSWLFPITKGATTIYESWDGASLFFGSFNHYSFGAVCDYLFSYVSGIGIDEAQPGYRHFYLKPVPGGSLTYAKSVFESPYGTIRSQWEKQDEITLFTFEIPANTTAEIQLPDGSRHAVGSGIYSYRIAL